MTTPNIVALCGGVGGAKLAYGLSHILAPEALTIIVNTGDDFEHLGLSICPDIDTVIYTLADAADAARGWGRADERWTLMEELERLGGDTWFKLGDRDLATHLLRTQALQRGATLTQATTELAARFGIRHPILPVSDARVRTLVRTEEGTLPFQDYFVRRRCEPKVLALEYAGASTATLSEEVQRAIASTNGVILCPSNPYLSIAPMLAVLGLRAALIASPALVIAISPIVGGQALKGPAAKMMAELGADVSGLGVARLYRDFLDAMVLDLQDEPLAEQRRADDPALCFAQTVMRTREDRIALARECVRLLSELRR